MADTDSRKLDPTQWVDRYGDYLFSYAVKRLRDAEAAEEVVQETFVAGLRARDQYAARGDEQAWLLGILKRKIVDLFRARQRQTALDSETEGGDPATLLFDQRGHWRSDTRLLGELPQDPILQGEFWKAFRRCLAGLPQRQADVFALREIDAQSSENICKDLEITQSNLWVLLHRARLALAKCLSTHWHPQESSSS